MILLVQINFAGIFFSEIWRAKQEVQMAVFLACHLEDTTRICGKPTKWLTYHGKVL